VRYVRGEYGEPPGEIDADVRAKALALPVREATRYDLGEARARYGDTMSEGELLLRMMLPAEQVDAIKSKQPGCAATWLHESPVVTLVRELTRRNPREVEIRTPSMRLRLR